MSFEIWYDCVSNRCHEPIISERHSSMAKSKQMYIEQKTDGVRFLDDRGPAVVGEVVFSRTFKTIRFQERIFERIRGGGIYGNYRCLQDGNEYWISGVKKRGTNRLVF